MAGRTNSDDSLRPDLVLDVLGVVVSFSALIALVTSGKTLAEIFGFAPILILQLGCVGLLVRALAEFVIRLVIRLLRGLKRTAFPHIMELETT